MVLVRINQAKTNQTLREAIIKHKNQARIVFLLENRQMPEL